nr:ribose-phosphate pyrophosphokinase-like domain-containing protein [Burkholderia ubonensis]
MSHSTFDLFAFSTSRPFGERIAAHLGVALAPHEERPFEDGEHKTRPLVSVRGHDVYAWIRDTDTRVGSVLQRFPITYRICKPRRFRLPFKRYILANKKTKSRVPPGTEAASSPTTAVSIDRTGAGFLS